MPGLHSGHRERMRERVRKSGADALEKHELLEFLMYPFVPYKDTNPLGHELIDRFGSLNDVINASYEQLFSIKGMTEKGALFLTAVAALNRKISEEQKPVSGTIKNIRDAVDSLSRLLRGAKVEQLATLYLDTQGKILYERVVARGGPSAINVYKRDLLETALYRNAGRIIIGHNHPAGSLEPSGEDIAFTEEIETAVSALDIELVDHLIVTDSGRYYSFKHSRGENNELAPKRVPSLQQDSRLRAAEKESKSNGK